jgi:GNAT superfamily N-acetyltransferase
VSQLGRAFLYIHLLPRSVRLSPGFDEMTIRVEPVQWEDIPALAKISNDTMQDDRHTQLKVQSKVPYQMGEVATECLNMWMPKENLVCTKAVDTETGEILGGMYWGFAGCEKNEIPRTDPGPRPASPAVEIENQDSSESLEKEEGIKQLEQRTNEDMKKRQGLLMSPGTKCMFILMFMVSPIHQGKGVGSALLKWGTDVADQIGTFIWVHSSERAWKVFQSRGFEVAYTLDIDLDEYAPFPPAKGVGKEDGTWGRYVFRYMKRLPLAGFRMNSRFAEKASSDCNE